MCKVRYFLKYSILYKDRNDIKGARVESPQEGSGRPQVWIKGVRRRRDLIRGLAATPGGRLARPPESAARGSATWREPWNRPRGTGEGLGQGVPSESEAGRGGNRSGRPGACPAAADTAGRDRWGYPAPHRCSALPAVAHAGGLSPPGSGRASHSALRMSASMFCILGTRKGGLGAVMEVTAARKSSQGGRSTPEKDNGL